MIAFRPSRPQRVSDLLARAIPALAEHMLEETICREWAAVAGPELARRSRPGALDRGGALEVYADNSPWLTELTMRSGDLLARLRERYGPSVTSLRFSLGRVSPRSGEARPRRRSGTTRPAALGADEAREIEALVAPVRDPEIAAALRRLLTKDRLARRQRDAAGPQAGASS